MTPVEPDRQPAFGNRTDAGAVRVHHADGGTAYGVDARELGETAPAIDVEPIPLATGGLGLFKPDELAAYLTLRDAIELGEPAPWPGVKARLDAAETRQSAELTATLANVLEAAARFRARRLEGLVRPAGEVDWDAVRDLLARAIAREIPRAREALDGGEDGKPSGIYLVTELCELVQAHRALPDPPEPAPVREVAGPDAIDGLIDHAAAFVAQVPGLEDATTRADELRGALLEKAGR
jgi:hypothetical protein